VGTFYLRKAKMVQHGTLITFEGVDGAGKTTQVHRLEKALGKNVVVTREPGGTIISERIREIFLNSDGMTVQTELLLIAAARAQHVEEVIRPALEADQIVLCDRFIDATVAYQGYRGGIDLELIHQLNRTATGGVIPNLTFVLDLPPEIGIQRQRLDEITRGHLERNDLKPDNSQLYIQLSLQSRDRLDRQSLKLHNKVREGYLAVARAEPHRVKLIDATQSPDAVHADLLTEYQEYLSMMSCSTNF
jgi:dTMP kinase